MDGGFLEQLDRGALVQRVPPLHREMHDRHVHQTDQRKETGGAGGSAAILDRGVQPDHAQIQEQQHQFRCQARIPGPPGAPHRLAPDRAGDQGHEGEGGADRRAAHRQGFRQLDPPDQRDEGIDRHHRVDRQAHPRRRYMDEQDAIAVALLIIGRHHEQSLPHAEDQHRQRQDEEPGRPARSEGMESGRRAHLVEPEQDRVHPDTLAGRSAASG